MSTRPRRANILPGSRRPDDVDVGLALIDHDLTALPDLLVDALEGRDATGPAFTGKV
jgi:hypothetical protein